MSVTAWLARAAGVGHELAARIDRAEWHWERPAVLAVGLVALVPLSWWIVRRHRARMPWLSRRARRALDVCRIAVVALIVFILAGPVLRLDERVAERPVVALVVDASDSMDLPVGAIPGAALGDTAAALGISPPADDDAAGRDALAARLAGLSRRELLAALLEAASETTLRQLADRFDLRWYSVARQARRAADASGPADLALIASRPPPGEGFDTALGPGLELAMDEASNRALAAIVVLSDGRATIGIDPLEAVRRGADAGGGEPRAPIYAVPIGGPEPPADLALTDVLVAPEVALGDSVSLSATLEATGFVGHRTQVELRDADGTVLASEPVEVRGGRQRLVLPWKAGRPGTNVLAVAVHADPSEAIADNNSVTVTVEVSTRRARVLFVDQSPRWDLRFIDHAIRRDSGFDPEVLILAARDPREAALALPADAEAWARFDLVVLGDVPAALFPPDRQAALAEAVAERGVGIVFHPGADHLPGDYRAGPLADLFPVSLPDDGAAASIAAIDGRPFRMLVTARGALHPAFALESDASRNRARWNAMPPFFRAAAVRAPKPAAATLAEVDVPGERGRMPLVVEAPAGAGRAAWVGTDETFRWRRNVGDAYFWRFWGQALRSVARREDRPSDASWLAVSPARCEPGMAVLVELNLVAAEGGPIVADHQRIAISGPTQREAILRPAGRPGLYSASVVLESLGRHMLSHVRPGTEGTLGGEVLVAEPARERSRPAVDREGLESLADLSGGAVVEVGEVSSLPYRIVREPVERGLVLEDEVWDTWPVLVLLVGLYCFDIGIRRLSGSS